MAATNSIDEIQFDDSATKSNLPQMDDLPVWQYRLWRFKSENTKLERRLPKNENTHCKLFNFENWCSGKLSKIGHHFSNKVIQKCQ